MLRRVVNKFVKPYLQARRLEQVVNLEPAGVSRGNILISYILEPFLLREGEPIPHGHTHFWESYQMAHTFLELGFSVDVISYLNRTFVPKKEYKFFVSARTNFDRIARRLNSNCTKVAHLDTAHWLTNNHAAYGRLLSLQRRRGITIDNVRIVENNWAIESADLATVLGNEYTMNTYAYANKPLHHIRISSPCTYPWNENKDFDRCRKRFLWFGSGGFVHKGLDLVLEAFADMPDYQLTVCGPLQGEKRFVRAFHKELYETPNINTVGWVDVTSDHFFEIANNCLGLVYPTCAEGGGGSAITCMHAGLIPILSYEASVDTDDSGVLLQDITIESLREAVINLSGRPRSELKALAYRSWEVAQENHTKEQFARDYKAFVDNALLGKK